MWFAWTIVLVQYRKQLSSISIINHIGCDLLEKSYFCSIANNFNKYFHNEQNVVICLKNRTFAVSQTTCYKVDREEILLWFAWKIVLLQYRKQQLCAVTYRCACCDLLEKSYFCSIANNNKSMPSVLLAVVICLKNRTFAVSQTTRLSRNLC